MKAADFETHSPVVNAPLADSVQLLQAEIDQIMDSSVGPKLIILAILGMLTTASAQWLLNLPPFTMLALTLLYLAGISAFSFLKLRKAVMKAKRLEETQFGEL